MNAQAHSLLDTHVHPTVAANDAAAPAPWVSVSVSEEFMTVDNYDARGVPDGRYRLTTPAEVPEGCTPTDARVLREANHAHVAEIERLRTLLDRRPSYAGDLAAWKAWTETVYDSDRGANVTPAGRYLPVVEMPEPAPEPLTFREAFGAVIPEPLKSIFIDQVLEDQPEAEVAALEREHMGDPHKGTGIYAIPVPGCRCEACVPQGDPFDPDTRQNIRMILCASCGNKRCPHATDHRNACTGSNEPGQKGSSWEHVQPWPTSGAITMIEPEAAPESLSMYLRTPVSLPVNGPALTLKSLALKCADSFLAIEIAGDMDDPTSPMWPEHHANEKALDDAISELLRPTRETTPAEREAARVLATSPMVRA